MKQFIVLTAVLPLLLLFVAQYALDQRNHALTTACEEQIRASCEEARLDGYFSADNRQRLAASLAETVGVEPSRIVIEAGSSVVYRVNYFDASGQRGLIPYSVTVPLGKSMAGGLFRLQGNERVLTVRGTLASERLP